MLDTIKLGVGALAGAAVTGAAVILWHSVFEIPAAVDRGRLECRQEVEREVRQESERQDAANRQALDVARQQARELAEDNDRLNQQLLDIVNANTSDSAAAACPLGDSVHQLNDLR